MLALYVSLAVLGLAAVDPVGIAIVVLLLANEHPYSRSLIFLSGSFVSLMVMGLLVAKGFGQVFLQYEHTLHRWLPVLELFAGIVLLVFAAAFYLRLRKRKTTGDPTGRARPWLKQSSAQIFLSGAALVTVQSAFDVVFVIAMVRVGQAKPSVIELITAAVTYTIAALLLQVAVIVIFAMTPGQQKTAILRKMHAVLAVYGDRALVASSACLGALLLFLAI